MLKPLLLLMSLLSTSPVSANQNAVVQFSYDEQKHLLTLSPVQAQGLYWSVELIDQGDYDFKLHSYSAYTGTVPELYARLNADGNSLDIPQLQAFGKLWSVILQHRGQFLFSLDTVIALTETLPAKPNDGLENITPKQRYTLNNDGTVLDKVTGLQWLRCSLGQSWNGHGCTGNLQFLSMEDAAYAAFNLNFAGKDDWRLPSVDELKSLVYCSSGQSQYWNTSGYACNGAFRRPTLALEAFPDAPSSVYWTASNLQNDPGQDYNLTVSFNYGHVYYSYFNDAYEAARFVRGISNIVPGPEVAGGFKE